MSLSLRLIASVSSFYVKQATFKLLCFQHVLKGLIYIFINFLHFLFNCYEFTITIIDWQKKKTKGVVDPLMP